MTWKVVDHDDYERALRNRELRAEPRQVETLSPAVLAERTDRESAGVAVGEPIRAARWRPRGPQFPGEQRRVRLLEALEQQLQNRPLGQVSIADVAAAAGLGRSAFYFYFSSKHDAVTQLLGDAFEEEIAKVSEILDGKGESRGIVADGLAFIVDSWRARTTLLSAMLDARDCDPQARLAWEHWVNRYEELVTDYITRAAATKAGDCRILAHALIAMNERTLERHLRSGGDRAAADQLHAALVHIWHASLTLTPSPPPSHARRPLKG